MRTTARLGLLLASVAMMTLPAVGKAGFLTISINTPDSPTTSAQTNFVAPFTGTATISHSLNIDRDGSAKVRVYSDTTEIYFHHFWNTLGYDYEELSGSTSFEVTAGATYYLYGERSILSEVPFVYVGYGFFDLKVRYPSDFTCSNNGNGTCTITGYTGGGGDVTIPRTLDDLLVTSIRMGHFINALV